MLWDGGDGMYDLPFSTSVFVFVRVRMVHLFYECLGYCWKVRGAGRRCHVPMSIISEYRRGGSGSEETERAQKTADSREMAICIANVWRKVTEWSLLLVQLNFL